MYYLRQGSHIHQYLVQDQLDSSAVIPLSTLYLLLLNLDIESDSTVAVELLCISASVSFSETSTA